MTSQDAVDRAQFAAALRQLRELHQWSVEDLARRMRSAGHPVSLRKLKLLERGGVAIDDELIRVLKHVLDDTSPRHGLHVDVEDLFSVVRLGDRSRIDIMTVTVHRSLAEQEALLSAWLEGGGRLRLLVADEASFSHDQITALALAYGQPRYVLLAEMAFSMALCKQYLEAFAGKVEVRCATHVERDTPFPFPYRAYVTWNDEVDGSETGIVVPYPPPGQPLVIGQGAGPDMVDVQRTFTAMWLDAAPPALHDDA